MRVAHLQPEGQQLREEAEAGRAERRALGQVECRQPQRQRPQKFVRHRALGAAEVSHVFA